MNFNDPRIQEQILQYFMFTDKRKIPIDQNMITHDAECIKLGNTVMSMLKDGYIKDLYIDKLSHEVRFSQPLQP